MHHHLSASPGQMACSSPSDSAAARSATAASTPHSPPAPRRRSHAEYRWTQDKFADFVGALARCGKIAEAARSVGMSRQSVYRLLARHPGLRDPCQEAQDLARARRAARRKRPVAQPVSSAQGDSLERAW